MADPVLSTLQSRISTLRTNIQTRTASLRSRIPALGRMGPAAGSGEAFEAIGTGAIITRVRGLLPGGHAQVGWKDGNPAGPLGLGGPGGGIGGSAGLQLLTSGGLVSTIRTKGLMGTLTGGGLMQTISAGGFRPALATKPPTPQTPPAAGPAGYRKFV